MTTMKTIVLLASMLLFAGAFNPVAAKRMADPQYRYSMVIPDGWEVTSPSGVPGFRAQDKEGFKYVDVFITPGRSATLEDYLKADSRSAADFGIRLTKWKHRAVNGINFYRAVGINHRSDIDIRSLIWVTAVDGNIYQICFTALDPEKSADLTKMIESFSLRK
jgi:hypothetical protein